jgi:hypothetical protein
MRQKFFVSRMEILKSIVIDDDINSVEKVINLCIDTEKVIKRLEPVIQNNRALKIAKEAVSNSLTQDSIDAFLRHSPNNHRPTSPLQLF